MKNIFIFILSFFLVIPIFSQVGVNVTNPTETLDVNGTLRIREINNGTNLAASDSILVINGSGVVQKVSAATVVSEGSASAGTIGGILPVLTDGTVVTGDGTTNNEITLGQNGATTGQVLKWDGTTWTPSNDIEVYLPKYISINEYVRNEPVLEQMGRIMFNIHDDLSGYKTDKMSCSVYKLGNSSTLEITPILRRGNVDSSINESVIFNPSVVYSGSSSGGSNTVLQTGDIILLDIVTPVSFSDAPEGLTCTIKLYK